MTQYNLLEIPLLADNKLARHSLVFSFCSIKSFFMYAKMFAREVRVTGRKPVILGRAKLDNSLL